MSGRELIVFADDAVFIDQKLGEMRSVRILDGFKEVLREKPILETLRAMSVAQVRNSFGNGATNVGEKELVDQVKGLVAMNITAKVLLARLFFRRKRTFFVPQIRTTTQLPRLQTLTALHATDVELHTRGMSALNDGTANLLRRHGNT